MFYDCNSFENVAAANELIIFHLIQLMQSYLAFGDQSFSSCSSVRSNKSAISVFDSLPWTPHLHPRRRNEEEEVKNHEALQWD